MLNQPRVNLKFILEGGSVRSRFDLRSWINYVQDLGVGEIFVNSISRDGTKSGFDIDLVSYIEDYSNVPAIICGGAGEIDHFLDNKLRTISGIAAETSFILLIQCHSLKK